MRELPCRRIEVDEIWAYIGKKQRHMTVLDDPRRFGDQYTFVALDPETKIVLAYRIGKRDLPTATAFLADLSDRLANRVQLSSVALSAYIEATERAFGADIDFERQNLTMRMSMRRFTRLTNAFSKKIENLRAAVSLHFAHYNFVRVNRTLRVTPAMETQVSDRLWPLDELVERTSE